MYYRLESEFKKIADNFIQLNKQIPSIMKIVQLCISCLQDGNKIMFCGNGGSAADSQHLAAELVGRYKINRLAMNVIALTTDTSILTAVGNDYGYDTIFERQVEGLGRAGDILIGLSTSGNSLNVVNAVKKAKELGITTISFTGENGGELKKISDIVLTVPSDQANHIQEMHIATGHLICHEIEKALSEMNKALFIDIDDIININSILTSPQSVQFTEHIFDVCQAAQKKKYKIIVLPNHASKDPDVFSKKNIEKIIHLLKEAFLEKNIVITDIFDTHHFYQKETSFASYLDSISKYQKEYDLDLSHSILLGNSEQDIEIGLSSGIGQTILYTPIPVITKATHQIKELLDLKKYLH